MEDKKVWDVKRLENQAKGKLAFEHDLIKNLEISKKNNLTVLDIGCSNGFKTYSLFNKDNVERVIGIDWSNDAIIEANSRYKNDKFSFICDDIYNHNFDITFDIVYISFVLHHSEDKLKLLSKVYSLLNNHGVIIVKTIDDSSIISYPDEKNIVKKICKLYDKKTKYMSINNLHTDRHHGKKCYSQLFQSNFKNIKLTINSGFSSKKTQEEVDKSFEVGFGFRRAPKEYENNRYAKKMNKLLQKARELFEKSDYIYVNPAYYYTAEKIED